MALDSRFILAYPFSDYFVDKDTGLPLANGLITFYRDSARTVLKPIYTLSGVPPYTTASYVQLPNPMQLSATGNPQDNDGNNVDIYFFPYLGLPSQNEANVDLYYMTCQSENAVPQFTRAAIPQLTQSETPEQVENAINYISNSQFITHNNGQSNGSLADGQLTQLITPIAPGGWTFERSVNNDTDYVTFYRFGSAIIPPPGGNPRYAVEINLTAPAPTSIVRDLRIKFPNVNMFSDLQKVFTFGFVAQALDGVDIPVTVSVIKFFGTGGSPSPTQTIILDNVTISSNVYSPVSVPFNLGLNTGFVIGQNDDDYIQFAITFPPSTAAHARLTDFIITHGDIDFQSFPDTTVAQELTPTLAGNTIPNYEGRDLYLPVRMGINGYEFDNSGIGKIYACAYPPNNLDVAELYCDGTGYIYRDYSPARIPYRRLGDVLFDLNLGAPIFGTGPLFVTASPFNYATNALFLSTNKTGSQTVTSDGTGGMGTGFTFTEPFAGNSDISMTGYYQGGTSTIATIVANTVGSVAVYAADFDTGFTVSPIRLETSSYQIFTVDTSPGLPSAGSYFFFQTTPSIDFYVWFRVNGMGADPGASGTGIRIDILSTYTTADVAKLIVAAISRYQVSAIVIPAAPTAGKWFRFYANSQQYYVWYTVNGVGTEPTVANAIGIQVNIPTGATTTQVRNLTSIIINRYSYAVPDLRGMVIRGYDQTAQWDVDNVTRLSKMVNGGGNLLGTIEIDSVIKHEHTIPTSAIGAPGEFGLLSAVGQIPITNHLAVTRMTTADLSTTTLPTNALITSLLINPGETRGTNMALNYVIKY